MQKLSLQIILLEKNNLLITLWSQIWKELLHMDSWINHPFPARPCHALLQKVASVLAKTCHCTNFSCTWPVNQCHCCRKGLVSWLKHAAALNNFCFILNPPWFTSHTILGCRGSELIMATHLKVFFVRGLIVPSTIPQQSVCLDPNKAAQSCYTNSPLRKSVQLLGGNIPCHARSPLDIVLWSYLMIVYDRCSLDGYFCRPS